MSNAESAEPVRDRFGRVASPCVDVCALDDDDICIGCQRSIEEICAWGAASDAERRQILMRVESRRNGKDA